MNKIEVLCVDETITVLIDGKLIDYLFDPIEFVIPIHDEVSNQYFFTCSCDIAGCAGWHEGFTVVRTPRTVTWVRLDEDQDGIDKTLSFDAKQYLDAQYECINQLYAMANRRSKMTFDPELEEWETGEDRFFMGFTNAAELEDTIRRATTWANKIK